MTESEEHTELADEYEKQADELEDKSAGLKQEISDTQQDWEAKRGDPAVPGASPPEDSEASQKRG